VYSASLSSLYKQHDGSFKLEMITQNLGTNPQIVKNFALKRLAIDLLQCREEQLPLIAAEPLDSDMFEWHANLVGPQGSSYEDVVFHFIIKIPVSYPREPPRVTICSYLEHPNVFGEWICLDMLQGDWVPNRGQTQTRRDVGFGWTPAYNMQTILIQLQAFLFDICDTTFYSKLLDEFSLTSTIERARAEAKHFQCSKCKHKGSHPWPRPLCWDDRLRFMVPSDEIADVEHTKRELYTFLDRIEWFVVNNDWPNLQPMQSGSFFSWTLLPWYHSQYLTTSEIRREMGTKSMKPNHCNIIRGLIHRAYEYLYQSPRPPPLKHKFLEYMYRIESSIDLAVSFTYNNTNRMRQRGYWQWFNQDLAALSKIKQSTNNENNNNDDAKNGEWKNFPISISQQIEALYLRFEADLRHPNELVQILPSHCTSWKEFKLIQKARQMVLDEKKGIQKKKEKEK